MDLNCGHACIVTLALSALACGPQVHTPADDETGSSDGSDTGTGNLVTSATIGTATIDPDSGPEPATTASVDDDTSAVTTASTDTSDDETTDTPGTTTGAVDACGDGNVGPGEQCDGSDLDGWSCAALGLDRGELACDPMTCTFDTSGCRPSPTGCGDGNVQPGEQCDGARLQGFDCASLGLGGGTLACDPITCTFDTSMCMGGGGGTSG